MEVNVGSTDESRVNVGMNGRREFSIDGSWVNDDGLWASSSMNVGVNVGSVGINVGSKVGSNVGSDIGAKDRGIIGLKDGRREGSIDGDDGLWVSSWILS